MELGERIEKGDLALNDNEKPFKTRATPGTLSGGAKNYYRPYPKNHVGIGYRPIEDGEIFQVGDEVCDPRGTTWTSCNWIAGHKKDGLFCLYRRKIDQPTTNKRTYAVTKITVEEVEESLPIGRYLVPGEAIEAGDLFTGDKNQKSCPVCDSVLGYKITKGSLDINAWYRPALVEQTKAPKQKAKKTYLILKKGTALKKGDQMYSSITRGWSNISKTLVGWIFWSGNRFRRPVT